MIFDLIGIPFLKAGNNDTPFVVYQNDFKEILMKQPIAVCFAKDVYKRQVFRDGLRCLMGHFRLCALMLVEEIIKTLCIQTPIIIQNVCVLLGDHRSLCMTGIALHGFDIAAVQLELVCNTCLLYTSRCV